MAQTHWTSKLQDIAERQLPVTLAQTINVLAGMAADDIRADVKKSLDVRSPTLLKFFVRGPTVRATKQKLSARVVVGAPKSAKPGRGNLLVQHDEDGTNIKKPFSSPALMVPTKAYRQQSRNKPRRWADFKKDMGMGTKTRGYTNKGILGAGRRFRTYYIKSKKTGKLLLFVRTGVGKGNSELLYVSAPSVKIPKRVRSKYAVAARLKRSLSTVFGRELTKAIASAREIVKGGGVASSRL